LSEEICFLTATELAHHIRARELSAVEVMQAHLSQIERVNPKVNAIVTLTAERAMARACAADEALARGEAVEPLHGLPVAHKDLFPTEGLRTTFGSLVYRNCVPDHEDLPLFVQDLHFPAKSLQFFTFFGGEPFSFAGIYLGLVNPLAQRLRRNAKVSCYLRDLSLLVRGVHQPDGLLL
jgi:hypothetical protein